MIPTLFGGNQSVAAVGSPWRRPNRTPAFRSVSLKLPDWQPAEHESIFSDMLYHWEIQDPKIEVL